MEDYLSTADVARRMSVSERTVVYWANRNLIPGGIKIGRLWRFREASLTKWLEEKHQTQHKEVHHWPKSTCEMDPQSIKRALGLVASSKGSPLERKIQARLDRLPSASKPKP